MEDERDGRRGSQRVAIRKVLRMGHPVLREPARPVKAEELRSDGLRALVSDMIDTLKDYGGIGLAAPQVGESIRLALNEIPYRLTPYTETEPMPLPAFVNPTVETVDPAAARYWERRLTTPGLPRA